MLTALIPAPYRWLAGAIAISLVLLAAYALGHSHGSAGVKADWDAARVVQLQAAHAAEINNRAREQSMLNKLTEAQNAATLRETKLRADYAAAHAAALGLRDTIATLRSGLPAATADACRVTADAALAVFGECADQYRAVAESADGCFSDRQTLTEAWPK